MPRRMARELKGSTDDIALAVDASTSGGPATKVSKIEQVIALLRRKQGATLEDLTSMTCWLPHTARAALSGLRKKGLPIEKSKRGDTTCYRIADAA